MQIVSFWLGLATLMMHTHDTADVYACLGFEPNSMHTRRHHRRLCFADGLLVDRCARNEYIKSENKGYTVNSVCNRCPKGADCECLLDEDDATCQPRAGIVSRVPAATWVLDPADERYYLVSCPRGHQLNNQTIDGVFSLAEQECEQCPVSRLECAHRSICRA